MLPDIAQRVEVALGVGFSAPVGDVEGGAVVDAGAQNGKVEGDVDTLVEVEGFEGIYAIGDSASLMGPDWRAKQGHVAEVMARNTAYNIFQHAQRIDSKKGYLEHINILCVMDTGNGAAFVYRNEKGGKMFPLPVVGHWMKKGWGWYCRNSKLGKIPRIPGM